MAPRSRTPRNHNIAGNSEHNKVNSQRKPVHRPGSMPGGMPTHGAEALLSINNHLDRIAEAEHVGILAAETYFPAQFVSLMRSQYSEIKANTFWF